MIKIKDAATEQSRVRWNIGDLQLHEQVHVEVEAPLTLVLISRLPYFAFHHDVLLAFLGMCPITVSYVCL